MLVVCQGRKGWKSLQYLRESVYEAQEERGIASVRASRRSSSRGTRRTRLLAINAALARKCHYDSVQRAVWDAGNNDRILILPGRYTEPESRSAPENDPVCNPSLLQEDASGDLTPSYEYQVTCPNDQNLIYVQGRAVVR